MWPLHMILFTTLTSLLSTQSIDEESYVQLTEGSGRYSSDDEDIEGSALPKDSNYATTPVVRPRFTQGPITRLKTNTVKYPTILQTQRDNFCLKKKSKQICNKHWKLDCFFHAKESSGSKIWKNMEDKVTTYATSTPNADIDPSRGEDTNSGETLFPNAALIALVTGIMLIAAIAVILIACCFKRKGRSNGYTPGQHRSSVALLNTQ